MLPIDVHRRLFFGPPKAEVVNSNLAGCAIYYNISGRYDQLSPASQRSDPFRKPHGRTVTGFGGIWTSPIYSRQLIVA
jgi:hypothetical protein